MFSEHPEITTPKDLFTYWKAATDQQYDVDKRTPDPVNPCVGCARNDRDNVCNPYFGHNPPGDNEISADVMFLGEAPGGNETAAEIPLSVDTKRRVWKDFREVAAEDKFSEHQADSRTPLRNYSYWQDYDESFKTAYKREFGRGCSIYYTNSAKCSDIHVHDGVNRDIDTPVDRLNQDGKKACLRWLHAELEMTQPDIVVIFDKREAKQFEKIFKELDVAWNGNYSDFALDITFNPADENNPVRTYESGIDGYNFTLVVSRHFTARGSTWNEIEDLWTEHDINPDTLGYPDEYADEGPKKRYASTLAKGAVQSLK